ncbi:Plasmodium exported protein, unknown function [Plasmodium sp. DRC-Itaito]|nr:Plasmodium exported protein, unknown function [Plasmodium sp. DRC-Itaito]
MIKPEDNLRREENTLKKEEEKLTDALKKYAEHKGGLTKLDKIKINIVENKFKIRMSYKMSKVIESKINDILKAEYEDADEDLTRKYRMKELMNLYFDEMDDFHQSDIYIYIYIYIIIEKYSKQKEYCSIMSPMFKDFMETHRKSSILSKTMLVSLGLIMILIIASLIAGITCGSSCGVVCGIICGACAFCSLQFAVLLFARVSKYSVQNDYSKHNGRGTNQINRPNTNRHAAQSLR